MTMLSALSVKRATTDTAAERAIAKRVASQERCKRLGTQAPM
jgi:hypothetical protein